MSTYIQTILNSKRLNFNTIKNQANCTVEPCPDVGSGCCFFNGVLSSGVASQEECYNSITNYLQCTELVPVSTFGGSCPVGFDTVYLEGEPEAWCYRQAIVQGCNECHPNYGDCETINVSGIWIENCENCIYARYEHPIWVTGNVPFNSSNCANSSFGGAGCDHILEQIFIPKPSSLLTSSVNINIIGSFDDSISINGNVLGSCRGGGLVNTSTTLSPSQSGFMLGAVDSYGVCCHGFLAICFSEIT